MSLYSSLLTAGAKVETAAREIVKLVRNALGHLTGDAQHAAAVQQLLTLFPDLAKWGAHALVSLAFGWLETHSPDSLKPIEQTVEGSVQGKVDSAITQASVTLTPQQPTYNNPPVLQNLPPVTPGELPAGGSPPSPTSQEPGKLLSKLLPVAPVNGNQPISSA